MVRGALAVAIAVLAACRFDASGVGGGAIDASTDPCAAATCAPEAACIAEGDGYRCECPDELTGDGLTCRQRWTALAAGQAFACGIAGDGALHCWGDDANGQLGDDATGHQDAPVLIDDGGTWTAVTAGLLHACGLRDGALLCWGYGAFGQLGTGTSGNTPTPLQVGANEDWIAVAAGGHHSCGIRDGGSLWCWGWNPYGQLGIGSQANQTQPVLVPGTYTAISASLYHTCGLREDGLSCWGYNSSGEIGAATAGVYTTPFDVTPATGWRSVTAGYLHTCALRTDGAYCWGLNNLGQLGFAGASVSTPTRFSTEAWSSLSAGFLHTCGVVIDGEARCWGDGRAGQLGDDQRVSRPEPAAVSGARTWTTVTAGWYHSLGIDADGGGWSWGRNSAGELGALPATVTAPVRVGDLASWTRLRAGGEVTCGLQEGAVQCLGWNDAGLLGDATNWPRETPAATALGGSWLDVAPGDHHACAIRGDRGLYCWGADYNGEVGDGAGTGGSTPVMIGATSQGWTVVDTGLNHSCAITSTGALYCWGYNAFRQLGNNSTTAVTVPAAVSNAIRDVDLGDTHTCAIDTAGRLLCWGSGTSGEQGDGGTAGRGTPTLTDVGPWLQVTAGSAFSCGRRADGSLWCWGGDADGQLGIATPGSLVPAAVEAGTSWLDVSAGRAHTCAIRDDRTLWCWGDDEWGAIGDGDEVTGDHNLPVQIGEDTDWADVDAGTHHTCATRDDGSAWCWGRRGSGQLGVAPWALAPVMIVDG